MLYDLVIWWAVVLEAQVAYDIHEKSIALFSKLNIFLYGVPWNDN